MNLDDPRLTAYALDELEGADRDEVAAFVATDPAAQEMVEEIRATASLLRDELEASAPAGLGESRRAAIAARATAGAGGHRHLWGALAMAACALLIVGVWGVTEAFDDLQVAEEARSAGEDFSQALDSSVEAPRSELDPNADGANRYVKDYDVEISQDARIMDREEEVDEEVEALQRDLAKGLKKSAPKRESHAETRRPAERSVPTPTLTPADGKSRSDAIGLGGGAGGKRAEQKVRDSFARARKAGRLVDDGLRRRPDHESYARIHENAFELVTKKPLATFSADVDTASYANVRRYIRSGSLPPADAVRLEEMINYFDYSYGEPEGEHPFSVTLEAAQCPWNLRHRLLRVGLGGKKVVRDNDVGANLVFLLDVSGSMRSADKLPLLVKGLQLLVEQLGPNDRVAIAVYAGAAGLVLDSTPHKGEIRAALDRLRAGGSTNGGAGIRLAYDTAQRHFIEGGINRVILATDGDFNVGTTSRADLDRLIEEKAKTGVFLTVLGFGTGNLKDSNCESLANKGNGHYAYIDDLVEARKVLVEEIGGTLVTIAKDVKCQIEFNPAEVAAWRLIGYENRVLAARDFNDDKKDAGEIGSGHTVTALFEIVPNGENVTVPGVDPLRYQGRPNLAPAASSGELCNLKLRYKRPDADQSTLLQQPVRDDGGSWTAASGDFKFAASVAAFGMLLRDSAHKGSASFDTVLELGDEGVGEDPKGYRREFLDLVRRAKAISGK